MEPAPPGYSNPAGLWEPGGGGGGANPPPERPRKKNRFGADQKSYIFGVQLPRLTRTPFQPSGREAGWKVFLSRRGRQAPQNDDLRPTQKPCMRIPSVGPVYLLQILAPSNLLVLPLMRLGHTLPSCI